MQGDPGKVKIGLTSGPVEKRRRGLATGHASLLRVLHTMPGGRPEETALHRRFAQYKVRGTKEWFWETEEVLAWLETLDRHAELSDEETALEWLARVGSKESLAAKAEWDRLRAFLLESRGRIVGGWTLWDILAGAHKGVYEPLYGRNVVLVRKRGPRGPSAKDEMFSFPIFVEACRRQGMSEPANAIVTGVRPRSHRKPQPGRWSGSSLRGYRSPSAADTPSQTTPVSRTADTVLDGQTTLFGAAK
jgi:hypothetical protein